MKRPTDSLSIGHENCPRTVGIEFSSTVFVSCPNSLNFRVRQKVRQSAVDTGSLTTCHSLINYLQPLFLGQKGLITLYTTRIYTMILGLEIRCSIHLSYGRVSLKHLQYNNRSNAVPIIFDGSAALFTPRLYNATGFCSCPLIWRF